MAIFFADIRDNQYVDAAFKAMRPAVVALIVAPIVGLAKSMNRWLWIVSGLTATAIWYVGISPVYVLVAGAAAGLAWSIYTTKRGGSR